MVRRRKNMPATVSSETRLPYAVNEALQLAVSTAASFAGEGPDCERRACRQAGRCCAAAAGEWCQRPLPPHVHDQALAMMVFATRLMLRVP